MIKKLLATSVLTSAFLFALPNNPLQLALIAKAAEKKAVVITTMHLDEKLQEPFGELYDEYQQELGQNHIKMGSLIANYAKNYKQMTNEISDKLIIKWAHIEEAELAVKKKYILKFRSFLPSVDVIRYFQIENRFKVMLQATMMKQIPLAIPSALSPNITWEINDAAINKADANITDTKEVTSK